MCLNVPVDPPKVVGPFYLGQVIKNIHLKLFDCSTLSPLHFLFSSFLGSSSEFRKFAILCVCLPLFLIDCVDYPHFRARDFASNNSERHLGAKSFECWVTWKKFRQQQSTTCCCCCRCVRRTASDGQSAGRKWWATSKRVGVGTETICRPFQGPAVQAAALRRRLFKIFRWPTRWPICTQAAP